MKMRHVIWHWERLIRFPVEGGCEMSPEKMAEVGVNDSIKHVDFMFGDETMCIRGLDQDGNETLIFENGRFVL